MEDNLEEGCVLFYDTDAGEGEIELIDSFQKQSVLMQMDVLQDWIGELQSRYDKLSQGMTPLDLQSI